MSVASLSATGLQVDRLMKRDRCTKEQAEAKVVAQMPLSVKQAKASMVIDNSGELKHVQQQVCSHLQCMHAVHCAALIAQCIVSNSAYIYTTQWMSN